MNTCILMAEVITNPELRKTPDDVDVANMMVEFPGLRDEDPATRIRVVGWRGLGVEMSENYTVGDRVVLEGRLSMNLIEMNGYKEKRAELVVSHIYHIGQGSGQGNDSGVSQSAAMPSNVVDFQPSTKPQDLSESKSFVATSEPKTSPAPSYTAPTQADNATEEYDEGSLDEIPF